MDDQEENPEGEEQKEVLSEPEVEQEEIYLPEEWQKDKILNIIKSGLSNIGKNATASNYGFTDMTCERKGIDDLYDLLENYPNMRRINFSFNKISDISTIINIKYLTVLNLSNNDIDNLETFNQEDELTFLEVLDLSFNKLTSLSKLQLPNLKILKLSYNQIEDCSEFGGHSTLENLELQKNKLKSLEGIKDSPNLNTILAEENQIDSFKELKNLPKLKSLNLKKNLMKTIASAELPDQIKEELPDLPSIQYINFEENKIEAHKEVGKLVIYKPQLTSINILTNPVAEEMGDGIKKETIMLLPMIRTFNEEPIEEEEVNDALKELEERRAAEEQKRLEEEEERKRIEEEENEKRRVEEEEQRKIKEEEEAVQRKIEEEEKAQQQAEEQAKQEASKPKKEEEEED